MSLELPSLLMTIALCLLALSTIIVATAFVKERKQRSYFERQFHLLAIYNGEETPRMLAEAEDYEARLEDPDYPFEQEGLTLPYEGEGRG